jgi:hypothetical protein
MSFWSANRNDINAYLTYTRLMLTGAVSLTALILTSAGDLKRLRQTRPAEEHWIRPPRLYELPPYEPGMRVCASNEKFLRPTRGCDPREPEIVAMAHRLGAYRLSEREFAENAFHF